MDVHDPDGVALLIVLRCREEGHVQAGSKCEDTKTDQPGQNDLHQPQEPRRICIIPKCHSVLLTLLSRRLQCTQASQIALRLIKKG